METACLLTSVCTLLWPGRSIDIERNGTLSARGRANVTANTDARMAAT